MSNFKELDYIPKEIQEKTLSLQETDDNSIKAIIRACKLPSEIFEMILENIKTKNCEKVTQKQIYIPSKECDYSKYFRCDCDYKLIECTHSDGLNNQFDGEYNEPEDCDEEFDDSTHVIDEECRYCSKYSNKCTCDEDMKNFIESCPSYNSTYQETTNESKFKLEKEDFPEL